ncbi:uncharacterized protein LACBIDRAFT_334333 [Laccaria bicolor S238N-H82]|uniref:guanosine-diphosphatase n=1 Tax=Laccaria bicolor (strain S238N-H82 / ATCC MYA-4686) TaxID=486041 RepID=B0DYW2_LACBS|nr:uncharacterized protein LACBIDRAFT_334333 [Laccaria bicolor S238N-H82]EDR00213.1 predicted protein [Laccaria bicolor S238N-H82]|eukprot:XP_001889122.1 predicted protein [Laccaria bicolor S238N-H82]
MTTRATAFNSPTNNVTSRYLIPILSPRSNKDDRLEGGLQPSNVGGTKVFAWKTFAISTGSGIHVYMFNNRGPSPEYELRALRSLDVLLDEACGGRKDTLFLSFSTARERWGSDHGWQDEGVYAWITANYLLGTIKASTPPDTPTYAVLDLGGASTQIVFEPVLASSDMQLEEGEHKCDLQFGGRNLVLYQHSYLGYGLMCARRHVHRLADLMSTLQGMKPKAVAGNPCLAKGTRRVVIVKDEVTGEERKVTMDGGDIGSFEACVRVVQFVLAKDAICELKPCSFNGVYQSSLLSSFPNGKVLLSYFYDRLSPLLPLSSSSPITISTIASTARQVCKGRDEWLRNHWATDSELMAPELTDRPEWCLNLTFMHALLRLGYEFEDGREVPIGKEIGGTKLGWCLGATIVMVGGELKCRI